MKMVTLYHVNGVDEIKIPASDVERLAGKGWLPAKAKAKAKQPVEEVAGSEEN